MKTEQQKPSAGAMRAADALTDKFEVGTYCEHYNRTDSVPIEDVAALIDQHTSLREMAEALELIESIAAYANNSDVTGVNAITVMGGKLIACGLHANFALARYHGKERP